MTVYAISDLHLPAREKPMEVSGPQWENHFSRIREDWQNKVQPEDVVLLPGDLTWAMHLEEAKEDIARVGELPGRKTPLRGNHDYWWSAIGRVRRALPEGMYALQNDSLLLDGVLFAGSRGWTLPPYAQEENDLRIYERERLRLEMSLKDARKRDAAAPLIAMTHYPPRTENCPGFGSFGAVSGGCVRLWPSARRFLPGGNSRQARRRFYCPASCDGLGFRLLQIELEPEP